MGVVMEVPLKRKLTVQSALMTIGAILLFFTASGILWCLVDLWHNPAINTTNFVAGLAAGLILLL